MWGAWSYAELRASKESTEKMIEFLPEHAPKPFEEVHSRTLKHALYNTYQHDSTCIKVSIHSTEVLRPFSLTRYISGLHGVVVTSEFYGSMQRLLGRMGRWPSHMMHDARVQKCKSMQDINSKGYRRRLHELLNHESWWFLHVFACNVCSKACVVCIGIFWIRFLPASLMMFQFHGSSAANRCRKWSRIGIV